MVSCARVSPILAPQAALNTHVYSVQSDDVSQRSSSEQGDDEEKLSGTTGRKALRSNYSDSAASTVSTKSGRLGSFGSSFDCLEHSWSCNSQGSLDAEILPNLNILPLRQCYRDFAACAVGICNCFSLPQHAPVSCGERHSCQIAKQDIEPAQSCVYTRNFLLHMGSTCRELSAGAPLFGLAPSLEITKSERSSKLKQSSPSGLAPKLAQSGTDSDEALLSSNSDMQMEHVVRCMIDETIGFRSHRLAGHEVCEDTWWCSEAAPFLTNLDSFNQIDCAWAAHFNAAVSAHRNAGNQLAGSVDKLPNFCNAEGAGDELHSSDPLAQTEEEVEWETQLLQQVEFYFSEFNLNQDLFLCSLMDDNGWVALSALIEFPRLQHLQATVEGLRRALAWSCYLETSLLADSVRIHDVWLRSAFLMQASHDYEMSSQQYLSACNTSNSKVCVGRSDRRRSVCMLATSLTEVEDEDADCVIMVHRVQRLGFGSAEILRKHCEKSGVVRKVLLSNKHHKDIDDPKDARLRPSGIAFVVMQETQGAAVVLEAGEVQEIEGSQLRFRQFVKHEQHSSKNMESVGEIVTLPWAEA
mmetsp:Transcript_10648/g.16867  ORF Transcript_10648/g.16867 Transcript_10648/m.16867 type:complete len:582 (+) Transcript_10648:60-1805(+)